MLTDCPVFFCGSIFAKDDENLNTMSDEKDIQQDQEQDAQNAQETIADEKPNEPTLEERYAELNDKYLRIHAEFDNFRKRSNKEKLDIISTANAGVLKDLLPVIDDFERAMINNQENDNIESVKEGFHLIFNKFKHLLETKGLKAMESSGSVFDVEIHEAIANIPAQSKKEKGKVVDTVEKGYFLNDKVIRFAKVVVGQ
ncbi:MAG: nucleotide exchange factor GrpE [Bacteroidetes bacterium RIFCSPHIGHO2_02_FULL_44_7]|nr:MAG: nucleotide exchange factor GrpE [Bacteroidetes bacterium RIFCSPHIGHO2_02_FULL_44_7]